MKVLKVYEGIVKQRFFVYDDFLDKEIWFEVGDTATIKYYCGKMYITEHNGKKVDYDVILDDVKEWLE